MDQCDDSTSVYQELFNKTEELFGFIEEQKNLQLQMISLMSGLNESPQCEKEKGDLTSAITNLACELKKSVQSQHAIQSNLNEVMKGLSTCQKGTQSIGELPNCCDDNIPQIENTNAVTIPNLASHKDKADVISIPDFERCISKSSLKNSDKKCDKSECFTTLRGDFKAMSKPNIFIYTIENFCEKLSEELEEWSDPFYTSHVGYRMSAKIGFCQDHIGIYVKLIEGDYDNLLAWPFKSEIAFTLLNQVDECLSLTKILKPHPCDPDEYGYWIRPKFTSSCLGGWGLSDFVDMCCIKGPNNDYISDFLRNDLLYIKIKLVE